MVKLFVTDLDGTLLPTGTQVSAKNIEAAQAAVRAGVTVTIATGRMYKAALPVARQLGVDVPIITYNGALIKSVSGKELYTNYLEPGLIRELVDFFREQGWYLQTYSHDELYLAERDDYALGYEKAQQVTGHVVGWEGLKEHTEAVCKLLAITGGTEETEARQAILREHFGEVFSATQSAPQYIEIINPEVSKAAGIRRLAEILQVEPDEVMAIGDGRNDLPMLESVANSVAMGNAVPEVKAVCKYQTGVCEEDGWAEAVYKYVLGERG